MNDTLSVDCWVLRAPRLNANDDTVTLTRWLAADGASVAAGAVIAEIETEKATSEVAAAIGGTLVHAVAAGSVVPIGAPLAFVGETRSAVDAARAAQGRIDPPAHKPGRQPDATAKARALAASRGVDLAQVAASGATIKERDVARHLARLGGFAETIARDPRFMAVGPASPHQLRVARDLRAAAEAGLFTTLAYRLDLRGTERAIAAELAQGRATSLLPVLLRALGATLPAFPLLLSVIEGEQILRYRDVDIAFVVRSAAGDLQAPVVRHVDRLGLDEIARECARFAKQAMRGKLDARDSGGACFTLSLISTPKVESFVALPPPLQTAILALGATRREIDPDDPPGAARPVATATLTYDHALCDGIYAAEFCTALDRALNAGGA